MNEILQVIFKISIFLFVGGSLLDMGLRLNLKDALLGLRNLRFVFYTVVWGFVLCPALAYLIAKVIPMETAWANGLIIQGLTPCAPFVVLLVDRVKGDLGLTAVLMLVCIAGTVIIMPLVLPLMVVGLTVTSWQILKPVLLTIALPMVIGMLIRGKSVAAANRIQPYAKKTVGINVIAQLILYCVLYGEAMIGSIGSYLNLSLVIYCLILATVPYWLGFGLQHKEKIVLSIGITTRNIGAAAVPCLAVAGIDPRTFAVIILSILWMTIFALLSGKWFGRPVSGGESS